MIATVVLVLRVALAVALYAFLAWAFITLLQELQQQGTRLSVQRKLGITFFIRIDPDRESARHFNQSEIVIGRDTNCDLSVMDEAMSAHHARVTFHHSQWWLEDLNSTNGILLNQQKLTTPAVVISGDEFKCGNTVFSIRLDVDDGIAPSITV